MFELGSNEQQKEMLGIYISGHPLEKMRHQIESQISVNSLILKEIGMQNSLSESEISSEIAIDSKVISKYKDGQNVKFAGIITSIKKKYTKNNKIMAFVTIEDLYGTAEVIVFENAYINSGRSLIEENIVMVNGRLSIKEDEAATIIANEIKDFEEKNNKILTIDMLLGTRS